MSTQPITDQHKHDVAISWLMVRLEALKSGLDEARQGLQNSPIAPELWMEHIASYTERIQLVTNSIEVLKRDAGIVSDSAQLDDGTVLSGEVV